MRITMAQIRYSGNLTREKIFLSLSRVLASKNGTRTRHVLNKVTRSLKNFIENLSNDLGGTGGEESFGLFFWPAIIRKK